MEQFIDQLRLLLTSKFPGSVAELEQALPLEKVGGYLIWDGFGDLEQLDRQRRLREAIREGLSHEDQLRVTTILTLTPDEALVMREG